VRQVHSLTQCRKESTNKTVNSLLDKEPRWLRPRTREETNERIPALSKRRSKRKVEHINQPRKYELAGAPEDVIRCSKLDDGLASPTRAIRLPGPGQESADDLMFAEFSETPMQDLLSLIPWQTSDYGMKKPMPLPEHSIREESHLAPNASTLDVRMASIIPESKMTLNSLSVDQDWNGPSTDEELSPLSTELSTCSLKKRLTRSCSTIYLKTIARLLKAHLLSDTTTSNSSADTITGYQLPQLSAMNPQLMPLQSGHTGAQQHKVDLTQQGYHYQMLNYYLIDTFEGKVSVSQDWNFMIQEIVGVSKSLMANCGFIKTDCSIHSSVILQRTWITWTSNFEMLLETQFCICLLLVVQTWT